MLLQQGFCAVPSDIFRTLLLPAWLSIREAIVLHSPLLHGLPPLLKRHEPVLLQALVPEPAIEALDTRVLHGLARRDKRKLHSPLIRPGVQGVADELGPVVRQQPVRQRTPLVGYPIQHPHDPPPR